MPDLVSLAQKDGHVVVPNLTWCERPAVSPSASRHARTAAADSRIHDLSLPAVVRALGKQHTLAKDLCQLLAHAIRFGKVVCVRQNVLQCDWVGGVEARLKEEARVVCRKGLSNDFVRSVVQQDLHRE